MSTLFRKEEKIKNTPIYQHENDIPGKKQRTSSAHQVSAWAALGIILGLLGMQMLKPLSGPATQDQPVNPPVKQASITEFLDEAERQSVQAVDESLELIDRFFSKAARNAPAFVESVMGLGSKWRLMADHVPFTRDDRHAKFLRDAFEEKLFSGDELVAAMEQAVTHYLGQIDRIENVMLTAMQNDLPDISPECPLMTLGPDDLVFAYRKAMEQVNADAHAKVSTDLTKDIATMTTLEILGQVAVRLGVSSGILGAGTMSSIYSFGLGLAAAVVVDVAVSWVWEWYMQPKAKLTAKIRQQLDLIKRLVVHGTNDPDGSVIGLKTRLLEYSQSRDSRRRETVMQFLTP